MMVSSLLLTNMALDYFKGAHLPTNDISGCFQKASQPDSWIQPQPVGVDFRTQSETGFTTLLIWMLIKKYMTVILKVATSL
jgi:hypothetical protein